MVTLWDFKLKLIAGVKSKSGGRLVRFSDDVRLFVSSVGVPPPTELFRSLEVVVVTLLGLKFSFVGVVPSLCDVFREKSLVSRFSGFIIFNVESKPEAFLGSMSLESDVELKPGGSILLGMGSGHWNCL